MRNGEWGRLEADSKRCFRLPIPHSPLPISSRLAPHRRRSPQQPQERIPIYGQRWIEVDCGFPKKFRHRFFVGDVTAPLLGHDFLVDNKLAVDPHTNSLLDMTTFQSADQAGPATIAHYAATPRLHGRFSEVWDKFPGVSSASTDRMSAPAKHGVSHSIELKEGTSPAAAKVRPLFGEKLAL